MVSSRHICWHLFEAIVQPTTQTSIPLPLQLLRLSNLSRCASEAQPKHIFFLFMFFKEERNNISKKLKIYIFIFGKATKAKPPQPQTKVEMRLEKVLEEITDILRFITWNSAQCLSRKVETQFY